ncbi:hypothetical protein CY34DRAFT_802445 [Suillus luteus UH-Slu-Lm8-n1]|uniref:Uncharacterized protein n=1 Tax=Suillus luteus UH-Slu-Lm8-n1 TaxID=930992 RepID=A0A0D0A3R5_9AGAM|nr:hypothetical protein CY34DRAFT_802445 [Suillus luteus UH-Slu-Lm8-n1]
MSWQRRLLVLTILISSVIFALCWSFILWLWCKRYVILRDSIVRKITTYPTELTLISTVLSTILSVTTTALFSIAVKHALSHYVTQPLSLVELHTAIALTKPQPLIRWNHRKLSLITVLIVGLITLLNSSWTTLLLPTHLTWNVPIQGKDLDLGSPAFDTQLGKDMNNMGESFRNFSYILDIISPMSGTSASLSAVVGGDESVFAFNGVSYSKSSSGIVPAVKEYAGTSLTTNDVGLDYYGGKVTVNTAPVLDHEHSGLARTYNVTQQGLSAHIICSALDPNDTQYSISVEHSTLDSYGIMFWNMSTKCPLGDDDWTVWATVEFPKGDDTDGFLGLVICPGTANTTTFDIFLQGEWGYSSLGKTVCKVSPYVASFDVTYNNGNISIDQPRYIQPLQNTSINVTTFISSVVWELSFSSQTTWNNPLGQLLQLNAINPTRSVYEVLEDYFRGVVEFSGTYLRSAYSAEGAPTMMPALYSDQSAFKVLNGTMSIMTYGWSSERLTYIYILAVLTVIWAVTISAAAYSLIQGRTQSHPLFDAANPVHLMMASSAGGLENLAGFHPDSATSSELVRVRLEAGCGDLGAGACSSPKMRFKVESAQAMIPK